VDGKSQAPRRRFDDIDSSQLSSVITCGAGHAVRGSILAECRSKNPPAKVVRILDKDDVMSDNVPVEAIRIFIEERGPNLESAQRGDYVSD